MDRLTARLSSRLLAYALPFLYLLTSIAFYLHTYDSAQVKITLVQMGGMVLIGFWYVRLLCDFRHEWDRYAVVAAPLLACLASGILAFTHSAYQGGGLEESFRRVFYVHFALIALREFSTVERLRRLIFYLLIAVAVSSLYGLIQYLDIFFFPAPQAGLDPFVWRQAFGTKIFSTFGNPNFFGNFLVILTPITLALMLKRNTDRFGSIILFMIASGAASIFLWHTNDFMSMVKMESWSTTAFILVLCATSMFAVIRFSFLGLLFFLITFCVVVTESKGSWIGFTASVLSFLMLVFFYFSQFQSEVLRKRILRSALLFLLVAVVGVGLASRRRATSVRFRIATWVSTFEMARWHPIWGNGIGSFRILYPAVRRVQIFHIEGKHNTETDHAENEYWEVLQDEGIIGFGLFLWMIATFSLLGMRALRRFTEGLSIRDPVSGKVKLSQDQRSFYMLGTLAAFWGMLMHNLMDVSLRFVSSGIFLWLLAGLIGAMAVHDPMPTEEIEEAEPDTAAPHPAVLLYAGRAMAVVVFGYLTWLVLTQFHDAQGPSGSGGGEKLLWFLAWVSVLATLAGFWYMLVRVGLSLRHVYGHLLLIAVMAWPIKHFWGYFMADVHHNRGIFFSKQGKWVEALDNYSKVVSLNRNYIMAYYFMGNVYTDRWGAGDVDKAMNEYRRVWAIAPNYVQTHHQAGLVYLKKGQGERQLADTLRGQGRMAEAAIALKQAEDSWNQSLFYFKKYHAIDPVFEPNYARAAWVHMQLAEFAHMKGDSAGELLHQSTAEEMYKESLYAWKCRAPENDVLKERWDATHRHFNGEMFENLGNVRFVRGNFLGSLRAYRMSLWVAPDNVRVLKNLASVQVRAGRQNEAQSTWNRIRQLAPQDPDVQRVFHGHP